MENIHKDTNLLDLTDYELLEILKYLNATDLWQLNRTCLRLKYLVRTRKLWRRLELRDAPYVEEKIKFALSCAGEVTEDVRICSEERFVEILPQPFEMFLRPTNITILALENQKINGDIVKLRDFPNTLLELSLSKSFIRQGRSFFEKSNEHLVNLKVLILDHCFWFESIMLVHISKYKSLEYLSLYKCKRVYDKDLAYISLAGRFGFNKLRVIDCRFSSLGNHFLRCLYSKPTLREFYFENYLKIYFLEKSQRELDISNGSLLKKYSYLREFDDIRMFDKELIQHYFGNIVCTPDCNSDISDYGTLVFHCTEPFQDVEETPAYKSVLFQYPYSECTCLNFQAETSSNLLESKGPSNKMKSLKKRCIAQIEEQLESELNYALCERDLRFNYLLSLPQVKSRESVTDVNLEATIENKFTDWIHFRDPRNLYEMAMLENANINPSEQIECFCLRDNNQTPGPSGVHPLPDQNENGPSDEDPSPDQPASFSFRLVFPRKRKNVNESIFVPPVKRKERVKEREPRMFVEQVVNKNYQIGLKKLSLRGFKHVTDKTLESLVHLDLELLDVAFTNVTEDGLREFVLSNPDCRVLHQTLCKCRPKMHF